MQQNRSVQIVALPDVNLVAVARVCMLHLVDTVIEVIKVQCIYTLE
jgi:hypothetical protein